MSPRNICRSISRSFRSGSTIVRTPTSLMKSYEDAEDAALEAASAVCQRWTGTEAGTVDVSICSWCWCERIGRVGILFCWKVIRGRIAHLIEENQRLLN